MSSSASAMSLVSWANPTQTGAAFAVMNVLIAIFCYSSPVVTLAYSGLALLLLGFVSAKAYPALDGALPTEIVSQELVTALAGMLAGFVNSVYSQAKSMMFNATPGAWIKAGSLLYCLTLFGGILSVSTLLVIALELVFLVPLVWEKAQLETKLKPHVAEANKKMNELWSKIPRASHAVAKKSN